MCSADMAAEPHGGTGGHLSIALPHRLASAWAMHDYGESMAL